MSGVTFTLEEGAMLGNTGRSRRLVVTLIALAVGMALLAVPGSASGAASPDPALAAPEAAGAGVAFPNFTAEGSNLIRLMAGAFDPLADPLPAVEGIEFAAAPAGPDYHLVQVADQDFAGAQAAIATAGGLLAGYVPDDAYMVRATADQAAAIAASPSVRWAGYYQPAWRMPVALGAKAGLLDLAGDQTYRVYVFRADPEPAAVGAALAAIPGATVTSDATYVYEVEATAAQLPAIAAVAGVEWIGTERTVELHNANARWVNDTGVRDVYEATAPGRLTGAGQTAAVADTGINYTYDLNGRAHVAFRDCDPDGSNCKEAQYTMAAPGGTDAAMENTVAHGTNHRKMVAYFDIPGAGPQPFDESSHGSHTGGSVTSDQGGNGTWDGHDGIAPGAMHVHQNIGTTTGGLDLPDDDYQLWRQAYRPRNPASVPMTSPAAGNVADRVNYVPLEDARTHNNSYGLIAPVVDDESAARLDQFIWDHEDMVVVVSAGNAGPEPFSIGTPSVGKNNLSSGASANGRQPMASIDSMASFSSHGPTGDGRYGPDLATPGQIVISVKGGTEDGYHVAQGTSMSGPILTGLATLVRQYFFDGYGPAGGSGYPGGAASPARSHNPSAALVKAALINGAERMRGWYTGDDGTQRAQDGQWPSSGQGYGRVTLANSLYFDGDATNNWYHDVWRDHADAFTVGDPLGTRTYTIDVAAGAPLDVTLAWTDAPNLLPAGTPSLVNNLDLFVESPSGDFYVGNNMNTRLVPALDDAETIANVENYDARNTSERVRVLDPEPGTWTIRVLATPVAVGNQGFALAASGNVGAGFAPGPGLFSDAPGSPAISNVEVEAASGDTAVVRFETSEPTTATATVGGTTYVDSYAVSDLPGLNEGASETSAEFADKPMIGTRHEILLTGLTHGDTITIDLEATDLAGNTGAAAVEHTNPANVFQPDAPDTGQLIQLGATSTSAWGSATQLYGGYIGGSGILGAWAYRIPGGLIDPADVVGASVEFTSAHDWMIRYLQDPQLQVDLLEGAVEPLWGTQTYEQIKGAAADARAFPESSHLRGAHQLYSFAFTCGDLQALRDSLADGMVAVRYDTTFVEGTGLFSADFGFNRRSNGPQLRPRLVLHTADQGHPGNQNCDPATPAPTITDVGVKDGQELGSVVVSWETDVDSTSMILFREQGTTEWTQVGTAALTKVHHVQVFGLDEAIDYEFVVQSAACNGNASTDTNGGEGYGFFVPRPNDVIGYFTGAPDDQANKLAGTPTATFTATPPAGEPPIVQQAVFDTNRTAYQNPAGAYWTGTVAEPIPAGTEVLLDWYFTTGQGNVFVTTGELTVFSGTTIVYNAEIDLDVFLATGPRRNQHRFTPTADITGDMTIQIVSRFVNNDFTAYYGAQSTPSRYTIPDDAVVGGPTSGPHPAPSAGGSGITAPAVRTGAASTSDVAAGTAWCVVPGDDGGNVVADDDVYFTDEDTQLAEAAPGVLGNDTGAGLTATLVADVSNGTLALASDGSFTYDPDPDFHGSDSFTYAASDGTDSDDATVLIVVRPVNDDPVANDDADSVAFGGEVDVNVVDNDTDVDGDSLTVTAVTQGSHGSVTNNDDGTVTYSHNGSTGAGGTDTFTYTVDDGNGGTDDATVTIAIGDDGGGTGDKVTGGGYLLPTDGKKINFGFNAKVKADGPSGHLTLNDKTAGVKVRMDLVATLGDVEPGCGEVGGGPDAVQFTGTGSYNGAPAAFRVCVADLGEPGNSGAGGADQFYLECTAGCGYATGDRTADDVIDGGNIQVHRAQAPQEGGASGAPASGDDDPGGNDPVDPPPGEEGGSAQPAGSGEATVLILDPMLLTESALGAEVLTVAAYDAAGEPATGVVVTLESIGPDGSVASLDAVTDAAGVAGFTVTVLSGDVEHIARSGSLTSNAVDITGLV